MPSCSLGHNLTHILHATLAIVNWPTLPPSLSIHEKRTLGEVQAHGRSGRPLGLPCCNVGPPHHAPAPPQRQRQHPASPLLRLQPLDLHHHSHRHRLSTTKLLGPSLSFGPDDIVFVACFITAMACGLGIGLGVKNEETTDDPPSPTVTAMDPPSTSCPYWFDAKQPNVVTQCTIGNQHRYK